MPVWRVLAEVRFLARICATTDDGTRTTLFKLLTHSVPHDLSAYNFHIHNCLRAWCLLMIFITACYVLFLIYFSCLQNNTNTSNKNNAPRRASLSLSLSLTASRGPSPRKCCRRLPDPSCPLAGYARTRRRRRSRPFPRSSRARPQGAPTCPSRCRPSPPPCWR